LELDTALWQATRPQAAAEKAAGLALALRGGGGGLRRLPLVLRAFGQKELHHLAVGHGLEHHRHYLGRHAVIRSQVFVTPRLRSGLPLALLLALCLCIHLIVRLRVR